MLIELLPILLPILLDCINKDGETVILSRLSKKHPLATWTVYRVARKSGYTRRDAKNMAQEACNFLNEASEQDLIDLLNEAKNG